MADNSSRPEHPSPVQVSISQDSQPTFGVRRWSASEDVVSGSPPPGRNSPVRHWSAPASLDVRRTTPSFPPFPADDFNLDGAAGVPGLSTVADGPDTRSAVPSPPVTTRSFRSIRSVSPNLQLPRTVPSGPHSPALLMSHNGAYNVPLPAQRAYRSEITAGSTRQLGEAVTDSQPLHQPRPINPSLPAMLTLPIERGSSSQSNVTTPGTSVHGSPWLIQPAIEYRSPYPPACPGPTDYFNPPVVSPSQAVTYLAPGRARQLDNMAHTPQTSIDPFSQSEHARRTDRIASSPPGIFDPLARSEHAQRPQRPDNFPVADSPFPIDLPPIQHGRLPHSPALIGDSPHNTPPLRHDHLHPRPTFNPPAHVMHPPHERGFGNETDSVAPHVNVPSISVGAATPHVTGILLVAEAGPSLPPNTRFQGPYRENEVVTPRMLEAGRDSVSTTRRNSLSEIARRAWRRMSGSSGED